jgi:hypothetical protein
MSQSFIGTCVVLHTVEESSGAPSAAHAIAPDRNGKL